MPLDTSIYRTPQNLGSIGQSFMEGQQAAGQMRGQQQHQQIQQMQIEEHQQRASQAEQDAMLEQKFMQLFSGETPPTPQAVYSEFGPVRGKAYVDGLSALEELKSKRVTNARDTAGRLARGVSALTPGLQQQLWPGIRQAAIEGGLGDEQSIPADPTPEFLDAVTRWASDKEPEAPKAPGTREVKVRNADGSESIQIVADTAGQTFESAPAPVAKGKHAIRVPGPNGHAMMKLFTDEEVAAGVPVYQEPSAAAASPFQARAILGADGKAVMANFDARTGKYTLPDGSPLQNPQPAPSTTARETTEDERKTVGFHTQMKQAITILDELEAKLTEKELYQIQTMPHEKLVGMANRNLLSEHAKRYLRAFEQFTESRLRPVSGAAIIDSEYERDRRTYAKQYGETPALAKDRKAARDSALGSLRVRAGRAFRDDSEAAPEAPAAAAPAGRQRVKGPNGETGTVPAGTALPQGWVVQ